MPVRVILIVKILDTGVGFCQRSAIFLAADHFGPHALTPVRIRRVRAHSCTIDCFFKTLYIDAQLAYDLKRSILQWRFSRSKCSRIKRTLVSNQQITQFSTRRSPRGKVLTGRSGVF